MKLGKFITIALLVTAGGQFGSVLGASPSPILGQVIAYRAEVNGHTVPSGTTLLNGSEVSTGAYPAAVQLETGQVIEIGRNSSAQFQRLSGEEVSVSVTRGTVSFREKAGTISTLGTDDEVHFTQHRMGQPILANQEGVVGSLSAAAQKGSLRLEVVDATRIEPTQELVIRSRNSGLQEVKCSIESIQGNEIILKEDLHLGFDPEDLLIQRRRLSGTRTVANLRQSANSGADLLQVDDASEVNPLERIMLRSQDGRTREVACVRFTDYPNRTSSVAADATGGNSRIKIRNDLENSFGPNSEVIQGISVVDREIVTNLSTPVNSGQRVLTVSDPDKVDPLQQVMIQSPDGERFEAYCVRSVEGNRVILSEDLDHEYPTGSRLVQGAAAEEVIASGVRLQRAANCCCCCEEGGFLSVAWWWFVPGGYAPFIRFGFVPPDEPPSDLELPPTQIVP